MKNSLLLCLSIILFINLAYSQKNFEWDVIIDSLDSDKSQLYTKSKLFVTENWKSAQNVVQMDDKESGIVIIKGTIRKSMDDALRNPDPEWWFSYTIKFMVKDNKARIMIEDVVNSESSCGPHKWPLMPVSYHYPEKKGTRITGLKIDKYSQLMRSLRDDMNSIVNSYGEYLKKPLITNDDW